MFYSKLFSWQYWANEFIALLMSIGVLESQAAGTSFCQQGAVIEKALKSESARRCWDSDCSILWGTFGVRQSCRYTGPWHLEMNLICYFIINFRNSRHGRVVCQAMIWETPIQIPTVRWKLVGWSWASHSFSQPNRPLRVVVRIRLWRKDQCKLHWVSIVEKGDG